MFARILTVSYTLPLLAAACQAGETLMIADFETGTDGFRGNIGRDAAVAKAGRGSGVMEVDFARTKDRWSSATKELRRLDHDFAEVRFWVKSSETNSVTFRLVDGTGQTHQQRPQFEPDGRWHEIRIRKFDGGPIYQSWGGAKDKRWHAPAKSISFIIEKDAVRGGQGKVWIDGVEATLDPRRIVPEFGLGEAPLGNVFLTTEEVAIPVRTRGDTVRWKITDFWRETVAEGAETVIDGGAVIRPPFERKGYFLVRMEIEKDGRPMTERYTSFCVIPPYTVRDKANCPFGVQTHFAQGMDVDIFPLFVKAGIVFIRDEHYWAQVERSKGVYEFPQKSDRYMKAAAEHGIDPLICMSFGNKHYDHPEGPSTPGGFAAYGRYGQAILRKYGRQVKWLEIWNEYNGTWCPPAARNDRPGYYTEMLKVAHNHIKAIRPDVKVLGCATVLIPMPYLEGIFRHGGLKYMDAVVIHPYRGRPEGVEEEVAELQEKIREYNEGRDKPIWVTETGRHDTSEYDWEQGKGMYEKGRSSVARYLVRQYTLLLTRNVERISWYLCRDHMNFRSMGLLRHADDKMGRYAVAPAYVAYATLIRQLDGARFANREAYRLYTRARVYLFKNRGEEVRVAWATHPSEIEISARRPLTLVDMMGEAKTLKPSHGKIRLALDESAVYVRGGARAVVEIVTGPRVLADSVDDYSKTQGKRSWYYGYYDGDGKGTGDGRAPSGPYTDDDFAEMEQEETVWGYKWRGPARHLELSRGGAHPEVTGGRQVWAVRRWKSTLAGEIRITGAFSRGRKGSDGSEGVILVEGRQVFKRGVGGGMFAERAEFDVTATVHEGSLVEFAVTPGPNSELLYDATQLEARIAEAQ